MVLNKNDRKLIIFDCDGVLVDSEIIVTQFLINYLKKYNYHISSEHWIKRFIGKTDKMIYQEINEELEKLEVSPFTDDLINKIQNKIHQTLHKQLLAIDGIKELLEVIYKNGEDFCVASSGTVNKINTSLKVTGLKYYFDDKNIFSAQFVKHGKPAPDLFLFVAQQMGYHPHNCIVIEDSLAGINAALAAGMDVMGFLGGSHAKYQWYKQHIQTCNIPIVNNSAELLAFLMQTH
jgi:HAD superfamily hydrolase (TIGR01509 family)